MITILLADLDPTVWLGSLQALNVETNTGMLDAELLWFMGGFLFAFILGAFSMIIRATKGAAGGSIDL